MQIEVDVAILQDSCSEFEVQMNEDPATNVYIEISQDHVKLRFPDETVSVVGHISCNILSNKLPYNFLIVSSASLSN